MGKPHRLTVKMPPVGPLKVWSVKVKDGVTRWTTNPEHVVVSAGMDIISASSAPKMNPGESMESLWPAWRVDCYRVDPDWYASLPEEQRFHT